MGYRSTVCWCSYKVVRHNVQQFNMHASASIISVTCLVTHMHIFHHISVDICTMVHMMHRERQREMHTITWAYKHTRRCILLYRHHVWFLDSWSFCKNSSIQVLETRLWSAVERVERWRNHQQHWWVQPLASAKQAENRWRSLPRRCQWAELARIHFSSWLQNAGFFITAFGTSTVNHSARRQNTGSNTSICPCWFLGTKACFKSKSISYWRTYGNKS